MEPTNWAPEHSAALRDYIAGGMSYAEIARAINVKFNTGYSRSAALGRARRMGLAGSEHPGDGGRAAAVEIAADEPASIARTVRFRFEMVRAGI
jgi:GcrA cell cycle regulator